MELKDLIGQTSEWLKATGPDSDIVISSRIRLARNIGGLKFVDWANNKVRQEIAKKAKEAILSSNYMKNSIYVEMDKINPIDRQFLIERHLISRDHAVDTESKTVFIGDREIISIMVNEEDHLRLQVIQPGFVLDDAWSIMESLEKDLEKRLGFAFSDEWGYLTACPTNTGTGLRASVMMHLPAIVFTRQIDNLTDAVSKLGLTVRGFFGEGTQAIGNFYQISNQVTLGHTEIEIIDNLKRVIIQVVSQERGSREFLKAKKKKIVEDKISRAYSTLGGAHIITSKETLELLSLVRLGIDLKLIKNIDTHKLNELLIFTQPAHLQKLEAKALSPSDRDIKRAELINKKLGIKG
ncbi:MAG: protein arginine kinase [Candidatus Omnitrophica bacterium]|nr:protein arginine kinase [Candidatus Omnitrophota bacterium]